MTCACAIDLVLYRDGRIVPAVGTVVDCIECGQTWEAKAGAGVAAVWVRREKLAEVVPIRGRAA